MFSREAAENVADWMEGRKERGDDGGVCVCVGVGGIRVDGKEWDR